MIKKRDFTKKSFHKSELANFLKILFFFTLEYDKKGGIKKLNKLILARKALTLKVVNKWEPRVQMVYFSY